MKYCARCAYPENHPLNITFDEEGVCSGCRVHEEKDTLDWHDRLLTLKHLVDEYRSRKRGVHDCIVPVSGARDSYFVVHVVKNILKLTPLLVTYNKQYNTKRGIRNLAYLQTLFSCDVMKKTVSPELIKKVTMETIRLKGSIYWHCIAGQTALPAQTAASMKIPLVIWGVHQGVDQVGMFSHLDEVEMTRKYRKEHDLMGLEAEDLAAESDELSVDDLEPFVYPYDESLAAVGVRGIYLNNYIRWDSKTQHELMIKNYGYETSKQQRTFDTYNDVDCFHYSGLHDYVKYLKHGYGKVTDHASREIRLKRMSRETAIALIEKYRDVVPDDTNLFLDWLGMSKSKFFETINQHRSLKIWNKNGDQWNLKDSVTGHLKDGRVQQARLASIDSCTFNDNSSRTFSEAETEYLLFGRGLIDKYSD